MKRYHYKDKRVTVMGLGFFGGGVGAARYFAGRGARVTVTDLKTAEELAGSIKALEGLDVTYHLGGHVEADFTDADLLVVSPAVPRKTSPFYKLARRHKVPVTTEMNLFLQQVPCTVCGVTGSIGKSTTTAMIHHVMSRNHVYRKCHLGGNIGQSLLERVEEIGRSDLVVLELSSFMLEDAAELGISPNVAVVTNIVPNHLDRHGTMAEYVKAKKYIARFQNKGDILVLNRKVLSNTRWDGVGQARRRIFDINDPLPPGLDELAVPGEHNRENALAAYTACLALGAADYEVAPHLKSFRGLPDRLELVATIGGVDYLNDSKSTTPEAAITALKSFPKGRIVLIAGGSPKNVAYDELADAIVECAYRCVVLGRTGPEIGRLVKARAEATSPILLHADSLERAVAIAHEQARPGDVVLLSPACASYDMFTNYVERGTRFRTLVKALQFEANKNRKP